MNKLTIKQFQMFSFILALLIATIACNYPDAVAVIGEAAMEHCFTVSRSQYESTAARLGQPPKTAKYPEDAVYEVCQIEGQATSIRMTDGYRIEDNEKAESEETKSKPTGTYVGETNHLPSEFINLEEKSVFNLTEKSVVNLIVGNEGTVTGEILITYHYNQGREVVADCNVEYRGALEGNLTDNYGELRSTVTYHFVSTGIEDPQDQSATFELTYEIQITDNIMHGTALIDPENEMDFFSFDAIKQ